MARDELGAYRYMTLDDLRAISARSDRPLYGDLEIRDMRACGWTDDQIVAKQSWGGATTDEQKLAWERKIRAGESPSREEASLDAIRQQHQLETAASNWWDRLTPKERVAYVRAHPRSKFADGNRLAPQDALRDHLRATGWRGRGTSWTHPVSRRRITLRQSGGKLHHIVVTHANGDVVERPTDSLRAAKRIVRQMASNAATTGINLQRGAGSLHQHLGVPRGRRIPHAKLRRLAASDHPLSRRAAMVLRLQQARKSTLEWTK